VTNDLLDLDMSGQNTLNNLMAVHTAQQQQQNQNIMAQFNQPAVANMWSQPQPNPFMTSPTQPISQPNPFQAPNPFTSSVPSAPTTMGGNPFGGNAAPTQSNPFANAAQPNHMASQFSNMSIAQAPPQQNPFGAPQQNMFNQQASTMNPFSQDQSRNQAQSFSLLD